MNDDFDRANRKYGKYGLWTSPEKRKDLWAAMLQMDRGPLYTFGYFRNEDEAVAFVSEILKRDGEDIASLFVGNLVDIGKDAKVLIRPENVSSVMIDHPYEYEVERSAQIWREGRQ